jgi:hypothetical protein
MTSTQTTTHTNRGAGGRTVGAVVLGVIGIFGILIAVAGIALVGVHAFLRDDDGYYTTDSERLTSAGYALASDKIDLGTKSAGFDADDLDVSLRFAAESTNGEPVFVGVARKGDVAQYLGGVAHTRVDDLSGGGPSYTQVRGGAPPADPSSEDFWVAESEGSGRQTVGWKIDSGTWTAVAMNADAGRGVSVDAEAGAKITWLIWVGLGLAGLGLAIAGACGYAFNRVLRG